jgi:hypothetical protein
VALKETHLDFSAEDWDTAVQVFDGCWVIADKHCPGLNQAMEVNNRTFVFKLEEHGEKDTLFVFGPGSDKVVEAVKALEKDLGIPVGWVASNGGGHHLFLDLWYQAFPEARVLVPAKRIPFTRNGKKLQETYADRWELMEGPKPKQILDAFGGQIDCVIFDQLFAYKDDLAAEVFDGQTLDHRSDRINVGGFKMLMKMGKLMKDQTQPNDEVFLFHKASGLVIAGHNYQFVYTPKGYSPAAKFKMKSGGFPVGMMMKMMMPAGAFKSALEGAPAPIADSAKHSQEWEAVLDWDLKAWTSCHDPPTICGPDLSGEQIKAAIRESLARSGEDDPTGARLKWNIKNR